MCRRKSLCNEMQKGGVTRFYFAKIQKEKLCENMVIKITCFRRMLNFHNFR